MANGFTLARQQLAAAFGCPEGAPDSIEAPCLAIQPADPYMDGADLTYGVLELRQHMEVYAFVDLDDNDQAAEQLDDLLAQIITSLPKGWGIDAIGQPGPLTNGDWIHHGLRVSISALVQVTPTGAPA